MQMNKTIELFEDCGLKSTYAKTLAYLFIKNSEAYSRDIERDMDLRQPQVSIALRNFIDRKWVKIKKTENHGQGRPMYIYCLKNKKDILNELKKEIDTKITKKQKTVEKLNKMLRGI